MELKELRNTLFSETFIKTTKKSLSSAFSKNFMALAIFQT